MFSVCDAGDGMKLGSTGDGRVDHSQLCPNGRTEAAWSEDEIWHELAKSKFARPGSSTPAA